MRGQLLILAALFLVGCNRPMLQVRSQYLYPECLASEQVNTPDPCRDCYQGQEVIVRWRIPKELMCEDLMLVSTFRYGNREFGGVEYPIRKRSGWWTYRLLNREYWRRCGIIAYKIDLCAHGEVICSWKHHVWAHIINVCDGEEI